MTIYTDAMLPGAWNFRDVSDLKTYEGRYVGAGLLFRSSELSGLEDAGAQKLSELGVTDVFDLRDPTEVERSGSDRVPGDVTVHSFPFGLSQGGGKAPHEMTAEEYEAHRGHYMLDVYERMPALPGAMSAVRSAIEVLTDPDRRLLTHCAAGKDRTGWVTAVVLDALGVRRDEIVADYLASNNDVEALRTHLMKVYGAAATDGKPFEISTDLLGVREEYLDVSYRAMTDGFGSIADYLTACQVGEAQLEVLRDRLLV
ncbi:tyrosine-protein phosphatase [Nocardia sp. 348MFTsu5.1]|uniref:tyrosine-protein phosphatase n=1 Tax=Nocardia sp. 348MFTsu5.1 TaxID=1172185 RepID=UPI0012DBCE3F|nr:tyrosine-protein phosphatase [Nocardia sp. 348MFTsu5.1]